MQWNFFHKIRNHISLYKSKQRFSSPFIKDWKDAWISTKILFKDMRYSIFFLTFLDHSKLMSSMNNKCMIYGSMPFTQFGKPLPSSKISFIYSNSFPLSEKNKKLRSSSINLAAFKYVPTGALALMQLSIKISI